MARKISDLMGCLNKKADFARYLTSLRLRHKPIKADGWIPLHNFVNITSEILQFDIEICYII